MVMPCLEEDPGHTDQCPGQLIIETGGKIVHTTSAEARMLAEEAKTDSRTSGNTVFAAVMYFSSTALVLVYGKLVYNSEPHSATDVKNDKNNTDYSFTADN